MTIRPPTIEDVRAAAVEIASALSLPTPLVASPALSELLDAEVSLKLELATPVSAFKVRGGLNLGAQLSADERAAGLVTASTGNHGQSIAYAGRIYGVRTAIFVPEGANPDKVAAIRRLGAEIHEGGARFDDAIRSAKAHADATGMRFVSSADEPALIAGVGTAALEVLEDQQPDIELVIVPVGAGSGVCGWLTVRDGLGHPAEVWGVQSAQAPAAYESWRTGELVVRPNLTTAEGLATGEGFALPLAIMRGSLNDFLLVDDDAINQAVVLLLDLQHLLVEPAGAAALAQRERLRGRRVVLVCSGANVTRAQLQALLS
ncbi:MAG: pyridoxal-phosphate dependent enzyme [Chloroflexi bacterium]|nr:pyridoxal-phosphate dependent enzyme [Chloroflexota bacterium]MDA1145519.1 pyridoxal-phosphate dependent enzyme [Chloroflexota bacterium]